VSLYEHAHLCSPDIIINDSIYPAVSKVSRTGRSGKVMVDAAPGQQQN